MGEGIDLIQHRYGWTDEQVLALPYARFVEIVEVISKAIEREQKEEYTKAAFIGYQTYLCTPKDKKTRVIGFDKWLKSLGLEHKKPEKAPTQEEIERARKNAERIMAMDREKFRAERKRRRR